MTEKANTKSAGGTNANKPKVVKAKTTRANNEEKIRGAYADLFDNYSKTVTSPHLGPVIPLLEAFAPYIGKPSLGDLAEIRNKFAKTYVSTPLTKYTKISNHIPSLYRTLQGNNWEIPDDWKPWLHAIRAALEIAKLFTPPHIDMMIDRILAVIDAFVNQIMKK